MDATSRARDPHADELADRVLRAFAEFEKEFESRGPFPRSEFDRFFQSVVDYVEARKDAPLVHRDVARQLYDLCDKLEFDFSHTPQDVLYQSERLQCIFFEGYDPGEEPPWWVAKEEPPLGDREESVRRTVFDFLAENWFERHAAGAIEENLLWSLYQAWCTVERRSPAIRSSFLQALQTSEVGFTNRDGLICGIRLSSRGEQMREHWERIWLQKLLPEAVGDQEARDIVALGDYSQARQALLDAVLEDEEDDEEEYGLF